MQGEEKGRGSGCRRAESKGGHTIVARGGFEVAGSLQLSATLIIVIRKGGGDLTLTEETHMAEGKTRARRKQRAHLRAEKAMTFYSCHDKGKRSLLTCAAGPRRKLGMRTRRSAIAVLERNIFSLKQEGKAGGGQCQRASKKGPGKNLDAPVRKTRIGFY